MVVRESSTEAERPRQSRRWRYLLAVLLLTGGVALALGVGIGGGHVKSRQAEGFARVAVPGVLTLHVGHATTYYVYSEGTACRNYPDCHGQLYPVTVEVSGPAGAAVQVEPLRGPRYMIGGVEGIAVANSPGTTVGKYRVAASTGPYSGGVIAVGEGFPGWTQDWVAVLAMALMWAAGISIIVRAIVIYARRRKGVRGPHLDRRTVS